MTTRAEADALDPITVEVVASSSGWAWKQTRVDTGPMFPRNGRPGDPGHLRTGPGLRVLSAGSEDRRPREERA